MKILRTSGLVISRIYENESFYQNIKDHLTRKIYGYNRSESFIYIFYIEGPKVLLIPRFFPIHRFNSEISIINKIPLGKDIDISHKIESLRDDLQKNIVSFMKNNNNGIIQAAAGSGKTIMAIVAMSDRKKKTFVLVHKSYLVKQWRNRILEFTNLKKDDCVILKSANLKEDLDKPVVVCTDQTFTSLLRRNRKEFLLELNKANFGLFFADEVHTSVGAPTFAECSIHLPIHTVFGLSATPDRYDGNGDIIEYHLGNIFIPEGEASVMKPRINVILSDFKIVNEKNLKWISFGGSFVKSRYLKIMRKSDFFMNFLKSIICKMHKENRKIIVVGERINLLDKLYDSLPMNDKGKFYSVNAQHDDLNKGVTLATPGKIIDGVDIPDKDCLIITSPISNMVQLSGRISRIKKDKAEPILIDLVDIGIGCDSIKGSLYTRLKFYDSRDFKINFFYMDDNGNMNSITREEVLQLIKNRG